LLLLAWLFVVVDVRCCWMFVEYESVVVADENSYIFCLILESLDIFLKYFLNFSHILQNFGKFLRTYLKF
jgi:hypothetical protein